VISMVVRDEQEKQNLIDNIPRTKERLQLILDKGKSIQSYGNRITEYVGNTLTSMNWGENNILPNLNDLQNNPEFENDILEYYDSLSEIDRLTCESEEEFKNLEKQLDIAASGVIVTATTATITPSMLFAHISNWNSENPHNLIDIQRPDFNRDSIERDLDQRLDELDPNNNLVKWRKGSWQSFYSGFFDGLKNACHSMRNILTHLLDNLAENDLVKQADWWICDENTRDGVSKRQKIRYLICEESDANIDSDLTIIENNVDQCKKIHDELCAVAHNKTGYEDSVKSYLRAMEDILLNILEYRHRIQQLRKS